MRRAKPVDGGGGGRLDAVEAELERERRLVAATQSLQRCDLMVRDSMPVLVPTLYLSQKQLSDF